RGGEAGGGGGRGMGGGAGGRGGGPGGGGGGGAGGGPPTSLRRLARVGLNAERCEQRAGARSVAEHPVGHVTRGRLGNDALQLPLGIGGPPRREVETRQLEARARPSRVSLQRP